jgi:hypothetical protein
MNSGSLVLADFKDTRLLNWILIYLTDFKDVQFFLMFVNLQKGW